MCGKYADFCVGIEEKGERAAGRERFRDSEGVGLRANSPLRRGPGQFDRTPDAFALSARKPFRRTYVRGTYRCVLQTRFCPCSGGC